MPTKVRKQIYLDQHQNRQLKRLAEARGVSEATIVRELIDAQAAATAATALPPDRAAWEAAHQTMLNLLAQGPLPNRKRKWKRDDLYEPRLSRHGHRAA